MAGDREDWPRIAEAQSYLKQHKLIELFNNMSSQLIYHRPANPREFLINYLDKLQVAKKSHLDYPCLFDDANVDSIFGMLDPTNQGYITIQQYRDALETLGIQNYDLHPAGGDINQIPIDAFKKEAKRGLEKLSATYSL
ncbi:EF-hand calcium-binding domain-containing protein 10-like [Tubulanus polymorphus]|uniref:EF-hand calcium-binding domain-containing protein 10-like n=1 Tax=Tubulanus polymorphus TaxID=672921 RepID=UPI003DA6949E